MLHQTHPSSCCKIFVKHTARAQQKGPRKAEAFGKAMSR